MRVQLIKESTGFGYKAKVLNWIAEDSEALGLVQKISRGEITEIPDTYCNCIFNLVCPDTGLIVSSEFSLVGVDEEFIKQKYLVQDEVTSSRQLLKNQFNAIKKLKGSSGENNRTSNSDNL